MIKRLGKKEKNKIRPIIVLQLYNLREKIINFEKQTKPSRKYYIHERRLPAKNTRKKKENITTTSR